MVQSERQEDLEAMKAAAIANAEISIMNDPFVRELTEMFGATIVPDSIQPYTEPELVQTPEAEVIGIDVSQAMMSAEDEINRMLSAESSGLPRPDDVYLASEPEDDLDMINPDPVIATEVAVETVPETSPVAAPVAIPEAPAVEAPKPKRVFKF